jgi:hypothetical protein
MFGRMIESSFFGPNDGSAERLKIMPCQNRFSKKIILPVQSFCQFLWQSNVWQDD